MVTANHSAFFGAITAGFSAEASRVTEKLFGQIAFGQNFVAVEVDKSRFGGGEHKLSTFAVGNLVNVVLKLGKLSRSQTAFVAEHVGRQHKGVALTYMAVDKVVEQCPFQSGAQSGVNPTAVACKFCAAFVVDKSQIFGKFHVVFGGKVKHWLHAERVDGFVVFLAACKKVVVRKVGKSKQKVLDFCVDFVQSGIFGCNFFAEFFHFGKNRSNVLTCFFHGRYLRRNFVLLRLHRFNRGDYLLATLVQSQKFFKMYVLAAFKISLSNGFGILSDKVYVNHCSLPRNRFCHSIFYHTIFRFAIKCKQQFKMFANMFSI